MNGPPPVTEPETSEPTRSPKSSRSAKERVLNRSSLECWVQKLMPEGVGKRIEDFIDSFIPEKVWEKGPLEVRRARILTGSTFAGLGLGCLSALANYFWGSTADSAMAILIVLAVAFVPWLLKKTGDVVLVSCVLLTMVYVPITYSIYLQGGWASPAFRWLIVAPLIGTFFGGRKVGLLFGGLAFVISGAFYGVDLAGIEIVSIIPDGRAQGLHMITATFLLAMITIISFTVDRTKELAFAALEREVREREEAVHSLRVSEGKLAQAQHIAHIGCWEYDLLGGTAWWSEELYLLHGMEPGDDEVLMAQGLSMVVPEDQERVRQAVQESLRTRRPYRIEYKLILSNGERRFYVSIGKPQFDEEGRPILITGATLDITENKLAELEKNSLQKQLLRASHQAGMAEVATGLLQNMGNALSSLKTTTSVMEGALLDFRIDGLSKASAMIEENEADLARFFKEDPSGHRFATYFSMLAEHMSERHALVTKELHDMKRSLTQVDTIIGSQQSYASFCSVREEVLVQELLEEALRVNGTSIDLHGVCIETRVQDSPKLITDRHRLLQILVALIENAVEAISAMEGTDRCIAVGSRSAGPDKWVIEVEDNGIGIAEADTTRIFAFGFTTKPENDGVGLHTAALAAEILGGSLGVSSEGLGRGATFTLTLPRDCSVADEKSKPVLS